MILETNCLRLLRTNILFANIKKIRFLDRFRFECRSPKSRLRKRSGFYYISVSNASSEDADPRMSRNLNGCRTVPDHFCDLRNAAKSGKIQVYGTRLETVLRIRG